MNKSKQKERTLRRVAVAIISFSLLATGIYLGYLVITSKRPSLRAYAERVYAACKGEAYAPSCYDREIPKLMNRLSMEEAFEVTRFLQEKDQRYLYCHVLAHNLSYKEADKDLSKWKDVVTRCPTTFCNNGCQHGAIMRRFNAEHLTDEQIQEVLPDLRDVCEPRGDWNPKEVERSMCYHALGHLHMFITKADIPKSVGLCATVGIKPDGRNYTQTCTQGVLMSVYQPLEPEDYALVKDIAPTKETVYAFCDQFEGESWFACHSESWPLFFEDIQKPQGLLEFCRYTEDSVKKENCVATAMGILTVSLVTDRGNQLDRLTAYCTALPPVQKGQCFASAAFRLVQIDPRYATVAQSICAVAEQQGVADVCYQYLVQHARESFQKGSEEVRGYCEAFPQSWRDACTAASN
jgi:hypothetical protein